MDNEMLENLKYHMIDLNEKQVLKLCKTAVENKILPLNIIEKLGEAMEAIGVKYEKGEMFLSELIMSGEIMKEAMDIIEPYLAGSKKNILGKVVIGTVEGDVHDIGKNIVATLLQSAGFEVHDLGVDISVVDFIKAVKEVKPDIVAMSSLLTTSMKIMEEVIKELQQNGLRKNIKIIIGGAPISKNFGKEIGADEAAMNAVEGVNICKEWCARN